MQKRIARRDVIRHLALLSTSAIASTWLVGCKSKPSCNDVSGLSPDELSARTTTAAYVEHSPDPAKKCSGCVHFVPNGPSACGGCKVVKGPIDPDGSCRIFLAKPA